MGTAKRERQKQGRQARIAQAEQAAARKKRLRYAVLLGILVVALVGITLVVGSGGDDDEVTSATSTTLDPLASVTSGVTPVTVAVTIPAAGETLTGDTPCPEVDGSSPRTTGFAAAPPTCIDEGTTYSAAISTSMGDIVVELDQATAPVTVNNFVVLARYHFYDGVTFHRIIPQFMIQGGDAVGPSPGQGDPGYTIPDELPTGTDPLVNYAPGTLAMANSGPNTSGSQFFVMATGNSGLDAAYSVFGHVTSGQDVVDAINELGDAASNGAPTAEVVIESVTITEA